MPLFQYVAVDDSGKKHQGSLESDSERSARLNLQEKGLFPKTIKVTKEQGGSGRGLFVRLNHEQKMILTRQVGTLLQAGMALHECLNTLTAQAESQSERTILSSLSSDIREGRSLAEALRKWPGTFDQLYISIVESGEKAGKLDSVLERLADHLESSHQQRMKAKQAAIYPTILVIVCIAIIVAMMIYVVPGIVEQFDHVGSDLPALTQGLIAVSSFISRYWLHLWVMVTTGVTAAVMAYQKTGFSLRVDHWLLQMPIAGKIVRALNTSRYTRALSILNGSGVQLTEALHVAHKTISNQHMALHARSIQLRVSEGISLNKAIDRSGVFPKMTAYMVASGEASGQLDQMLERIANLQDNEFKQKIDAGLALFEPAMIITMSGIILVIVMSILLPIMDLNNMVNL